MNDRLLSRGLGTYRTTTGYLSYLLDVLLLLMRLYFGWQLAVSGWNKLTGLQQTANYFESLGIIFPQFSAVLSGSGELIGGLMLAVGLLSRPAAIVIAINMTVAYVTAHPDQAAALFSHPNDFVRAAPFLYLLTALLVLAVGPGMIAIDTLLKNWVDRRAGAQAAVTPEATSIAAASTDHSRRRFATLTLAAVGGLIAGALLRGGGDADQQAGGGGAGDGGPDRASDAAAGGGGGEGSSELAKIDEQAPEDVQPTLLLEEPHVCCGLNTCEGKGKGGENACAGQGNCATAESHVCQGLNSCKGQGGCGDYPGQNTCDGIGACAVPLQQKQWDIARRKFEELMQIKGREIGAAPENCPPA